MAIAMAETKQLLLELNYEGVEDFDDDQMTEIFQPDNRFFLLGWIANVLYPDLVVPKEQSPQSLAFLSNFYYGNGFCSEEQKDSFVSADYSKCLPQEPETHIFERIFTFIKDVRSASKQHEVLQMSSMDLVSELEKTLNVVDAFVDVYEEEPDDPDVVKNLTEEIEALKLQLAANDTNKNDFMPKHTGSSIDNYIVSFEQNAIALKDQLAFAKIQKEACGQNNPGVKFEEDFEKLVNECDDKVNRMVQYVQNTNNIVKSAKKIIADISHLPQYSDEMQEVLRKLAQDYSP